MPALMVQGTSSWAGKSLLTTVLCRQAIVRGVADAELSAMDWRSRAPLMWPAIEESYASLAEQFDLIVIEGAGSPAEINLRDTDLSSGSSAPNRAARSNTRPEQPTGR